MMFSTNEKLLKFYDGHQNFKFSFILYADFDIILKPVDEHYREKMNKMKNEKRQNTVYRKQYVYT